VSLEDEFRDQPEDIRWQGRFITAKTRGRWEYVSRARGIKAAVILAITLAGLFAVDVDGIESGPLADWVSFDQGRMASEWHEGVFKAALAVISLHVLAIGYYQVLNAQNLIGRMITGRRERAKGEAAADVTWSPVMALAGIAVVGALTWLVMNGFRLAG